MNLNDLDMEEYKDIPIFRMVDNNNGGLPIYIRKYFANDLSKFVHRHDYMQVNYINQGSGVHCFNKQEFDIIKGDIFVIPPFIPHRIADCANSTMEIIEFEFEPELLSLKFGDIYNIESFFDFAYIEPFLVTESKVTPRLNLNGDVRIEVEDMLNEILKEYNARKSGYLLLIKSLLLKLLVTLGREFTKGLEGAAESRVIYDYSRSSILNSVKYIKENYFEDLSSDNVAKEFMISPSYFRYLFKSITSKTFTEYINELRISKAMELLRNTDKRVIDICHESGFKNINHFNRLFRQETGNTPLMYKKMAD